MRRITSPLAVLAMILALALLAAACGSDDEDTADGEAESTTEESTVEEDEPEESDTADESESESEDTEAMEEEEAAATVLRVGLQFGPDSGLAIETDDSSILVKAGVTEGLVRSDGGDPVPALAESWERIDDTTWEFVLRSGVTFHDGSALDAAAVETAINYISNVAAPPRSLGGLSLSTEIVDDTTVRIITSDPDPILPLRLSSRPMAILAPAAYDTEPTSPIGTGPFQVAEFNPPDSLTVERFDGYWGPIAKLEGAVFRFIPDAGARAAAIRADEIDVADGIAIADLEAVEDDPDVELIRFSLPRTASLYANTNNGPMANPTVRQAVSFALDEAAIADGLLEGQFAPARGYFGEENPWAPQTDKPADAAEQAASLLEGVSEDERSIRIWTYGSRPELADIATVAQAQLQAVGFEVEIEVGEYTPLEERVFNEEHDLFLGSRGYYFDIADAGAVLTSDFTCEGGYNLNRYCSPAYDALMEELSVADTPEDRQVLFAEAAQVLADEYIGFPLVHDRARYAARTDVEGLAIDTFERSLLTNEVSLAG